MSSKWAEAAFAARAESSGLDQLNNMTATVSRVPEENLKAYRVFTLSENLREGALQNELQELFKKIRKLMKEDILLDDNMAGAIAHF